MEEDSEPAEAMTAQLKLDLFREIAARRGWKTNIAIARAIGVSPQQVKRTLDGLQEPTTRFVCGFLAAVPEASFHRTFNIVPASENTKEVPRT